MVQKRLTREGFEPMSSLGSNPSTTTLHRPISAFALNLLYFCNRLYFRMRTIQFTQKIKRQKVTRREIERKNSQAKNLHKKTHIYHYCFKFRSRAVRGLCRCNYCENAPVLNSNQDLLLASQVRYPFTPTGLQLSNLVISYNPFSRSFLLL